MLPWLIITVILSCRTLTTTSFVLRRPTNNDVAVFVDNSRQNTRMLLVEHHFPTTPRNVLQASSITNNDPSSTKDNGGGDGNKLKRFFDKIVDTIHFMFDFNYNPNEQKQQEDGKVEKKITKVFEEDTASSDDTLGPIHDMPQFFYPAPIHMQSFANTRNFRRKLKKVEHDAKPLLIDAMNLIKQDRDVCDELGEPIHYGHIVSTATYKAIDPQTGKKLVHVRDVFEVIGSKHKAQAILKANKYQTGEPIQYLRVDYNDVHYDIDID